MKKTLKLLILLMSLALIVGALSVVAFAKDGEDDTVIATGGDVEFEGTFDEALAEIFDNGDGEYVITLQGNCSSEGVVLDDGVEAREVTIDLNGYTLNLEDATTAFDVAAFNVLNVTGCGEIVIGSQLVSTTEDCDSVINFVGTGAGIKITSTTEAINKVIANGTSEINFKNVNMEIGYEKVVTEPYAPAESVITVNSGTKVTFENSRFVYNVDFVAGEGLAELIASCDQGKKQTGFGMAGSFFATISGESQLVLNNTYVKTPTSGVAFLAASGMDSDIAEGKYSLVMNGSTLLCTNDSEATLEFNKIFGTIMYNQRMIIFNFNNGDPSTADVYIKSSYAGAPYRLIKGRANANVAEDPVHITVDGSVIEQITYLAAMAGLKPTDNGEGLLDQGATYMTFKNNSGLYLANDIACFGGGNDPKNLKGTAVGNGQYVVDFEEGTRTSGTFSNCDLPEGKTYVVNPKVGSELEYVVGVKTEATDKGFGFWAFGDLGSCVRGAGLKNTDYKYYDGYAQVRRFYTMSIEEITSNAAYNAETRTLTVKDGSYVVAEDGKSYTWNNSAYFSINSPITFNRGNAVDVMAFMIKTDDNGQWKFNSSFQQHGRPAERQHYFFDIDTGVAHNKLVPGEWNTVAFVVDYETGIVYGIINGEILATVKGYAANIKNRVGWFDDVRLAINPITFTESTECFIASPLAVGYTTRNEGTFNPLDYVPYRTGHYETNVDVAPITVGNTVFSNINDALTFANENNTFVNLNGNVNAGEVTVEGYIRTNGYNFTYSSILGMEKVDETVRFYEVPKVNVNWYVGTAANPAEDTANVITAEAPKGNALTVPTKVTLVNAEGKGKAFTLVGWSTTYVYPDGYTTAADYNAAVEAIEILDLTQTDATDFDGATLYPVFTAVDATFKTITGNGAVTYYKAADVDFMDAFAKVGSGGTVVLLEDATSVKAYDGKKLGDPNAGDAWLRSVKYIDLNGYTLFVNNVGTWIDMAGGQVHITSSRPGAVLSQVNKSNSNPLLNTRSHSSRTIVNDPNNYITVKAYNFINITMYDSSQARTPKAILTGGTYINLGSNSVGNRLLCSNMFGNYESLKAEGTTFINAGDAPMIWSENDNKFVFKNCNFINLTDYGFATQNNNGALITLENCNLSGYTLAGLKVKVTGTTTAYYLGLDIATDEGKTVAYNSSLSMAMPAQLGSEYTVTNEKGEVVATFTADDLDVRFAIYDAAAVTNYKWNGLAGGYWSANVAEGSNAADLSNYATEWANKSNTESLDALKLGVKTWKLEGTEFNADEKVAVGLTGFGAFANVKLEEGFVLGVLVTPENYEFLSAESKALFTKVTLEGVDYYVASADRDVNEAFTAFTVEVDVEEDGYAYTTSYTVSVMDYLELVAAAEVREEMDKIVAYIGAYLNNAYAYFTTTDATEADLAALAAFVATNAPEAITAPEAPEAIDANGNLEIKLDLTATPAFLITSKVAGTVTFNGVTTNLVANETVRLEASVLDFDNALTFALEGDVTGSYCLANYAATIAAATEIEGLDEAGLAALKALVASFYDYVIYAENFR